MNVYKNFILFLRNPSLERDTESDLVEKITQFILLFIASFTVSIFLSIIIGALFASGLIENDYHAFDNLKGLEGYKILLIAAVAAPVIEETIFRGPLTLFKSPYKLYRTDTESGERVLKDVRITIFEKPIVFKLIFYGFAIAFAYVHLFNYQVDRQILIFSPILVAPQLILGLVFGYIRIRLGLIWAMAMHACYNGLLVSLFLVSKDAIQ